MALRSLHAKCVRVLSIVNTCNNALDVRSAEKLVFVKMKSIVLHAKGVIVVFVNMGNDALPANIADTLLFVNMEDK